MKTSVSRSECDETHKTIDWKCDRCDQKFGSHTDAKSHALLVHDAPVEERASPLGPIAFLQNEEQANVWIGAQPDCTIDWCTVGWYAPEFTDDEEAHYRRIDDVLDNVSQRLTDLREYETSLRAVSGTKSK